jgi:hypothetical protein
MSLLSQLVTKQMSLLGQLVTKQMSLLGQLVTKEISLLSQYTVYSQLYCAGAWICLLVGARSREAGGKEPATHWRLSPKNQPYASK